MVVFLFFAIALAMEVPVNSNVFESEADGESWVDRFSKFRTDRWKKQNNFLTCNEGTYAESSCIYLEENNLKRRDHLNLKDEKVDYSYLEMTLDNKCKKKNCCEGEKCANWKTGSLVSQDRYGFGSFRFVAYPANQHTSRVQPGFVPSDQAGWTCYGTCSKCIERSTDEEEAGAGMCVLSGDPNIIAMIIIANGTRNIDYISLKINTARIANIYRIDWYPEELVFYVNGHMIFTTWGTGWAIPQDPLHMMSEMTTYESIPEPDDMVETEEPIVESNRPIELKSILYRVRYIKFYPLNTYDNFNASDASAISTTGAADKTELFVHSSSRLYKFDMMVASIIFIIVIVFSIWSAYEQCCQKATTDKAASYVQLQDSQLDEKLIGV